MMERPPAPVLVVADFLYPNYMGGSGRLVHSFLRGLEANGLPFTVVTRPSAGVYGATGELDPDYERWKAAGKVIEAGPFSPKLWGALLRCSRETVLNVHHPVLGLFFTLFAPRKRLAYFFHGPWHEEYKAAGGGGLAYRIKKAIQVWLLHKADRIMVLSDFFGDVARGLVKHPEKVLRVPPMLPTGGLPEERLHRGELRIKWGIPSDATVLFTSRRLTPRTGVLELARMFRASFGADHHLVIVGKGELQEKLAAETQGAGNIRCLSFVSDADLRELMLLSDVYVLPTLSLEGFGMVLLEAMDVGLPPVVSTTSGGGREFMETLDPRLVFSMEDAESLKRAITVARSSRSPEAWMQTAKEYDLKPQALVWHGVLDS